MDFWGTSEGKSQQLQFLNTTWITEGKLKSTDLYQAAHFPYLTMIKNQKDPEYT